MLTERLPDDLPAAWAALEGLRLAGDHTDFAPGLAHERSAIAELADSAAFRNLLGLQARARSPPRRGTEAGRRALPPLDRRRRRDRGRARVRPAGALRGCQIVLHDPDTAALGSAAFKLHQTLLEDEVQRGTLSKASALQCLQLFRGTARWEHFDKVDLVLDTVEDGRRAERFRELDNVATPATILASTGAADTVAGLRSGLKQPRRIAVVHFAGPPGQEAVVELARPDDAADAVQRRLEEWIASLGRFCIAVGDRPGLLVMRVMLPAFNEAALLLREGMLPARIDAAMDRFGVSPGPLEWMDRIGLDAVVRLVEALQPTFAGRLNLESGFAEMVRQGMLGTASGAGFYRRAGRHRRPNPRAAALWWGGPGEAWLSRAGLSHAQQLDLAQRRMTSLMVIEAYHCLRERIVADGATLDFALATAGWAPHRGGPLGYARARRRRVHRSPRGAGPRLRPPLHAAGRLGAALNGGPGDPVV